MSAPGSPGLAGVHHLKLSVTDLARSRAWYHSRLGYEVVIEWVEHGQLTGYGMSHPDGGPQLSLRLDPERARAAAGFDYFCLGVPGKATIDQLAGWLADQGEQHAGVRRASTGWILPGLHDPDGHEIRFYTIEQHTELDPAAVITVTSPQDSAGRRERTMPQPAPDQATTR